MVEHWGGVLLVGDRVEPVHDHAGNDALRDGNWLPLDQRLMGGRNLEARPVRVWLRTLLRGRARALGRPPVRRRTSSEAGSTIAAVSSGTRCPVLRVDAAEDDVHGVRVSRKSIAK